MRTLFLALMIISGSASAQQLTSDSLNIRKISGHVYQHISYLRTTSFGRVECNGLVFTDGREAVVFDTPTDSATSAVLINWLENELHCKVKAIVATHFHDDCLGGLAAFHARHIPSYSNQLTITLARAHNVQAPQHGFTGRMTLKVGTKEVIAAFYGEGHTKDNIIGYFPDEKVMFGGCLIKETGADKGYVGDANEKAWPATVAKVKAQYPDVRLIVPGHGENGGIELLDYTIRLFKNAQ